MLLLLGAALHDRAREDLGSRDERATDAERPPRQLFGCNDHPEVIRLAALGEAAVLRRYGEAEAADLGEPVDDLVGDVGVGAMDVLRDRADLLFGEAVKRLAYEVEVVGEMRRPGAATLEPVGQRFEELGRAVHRNERLRRRQLARVDPPGRVAAEELGAEIPDRIGDERARQVGLELTVLRVVEHDAAALDRTRSVREVIREHLMAIERGDRDPSVDRGGPREVISRCRDEGRGLFDGDARRCELVGHAPEPRSAASRPRI